MSVCTNVCKKTLHIASDMLTVYLLQVQHSTGGGLEQVDKLGRQQAKGLLIPALKRGRAPPITTLPLHLGHVLPARHKTSIKFTDTLHALHHLAVHVSQWTGMSTTVARHVDNSGHHAGWCHSHSRDKHMRIHLISPPSAITHSWIHMTHSASCAATS